MVDYNLWQKLILGATKPFRTGANILAQNWGSALTGKDMSQEENQGKFLQWLAGGLTPEEQQTITEKPYLSALKSGAGMASTLAPFSSNSLRVAQLATDPLANRIAQLTSQGALEGGLGGFGASREGKEVQDTLTGAGMGIGGELLADYITNPQFRKMLSDASTFEGPNGVNMYKGALGDDNTINFRKPHPKDNTLNTDNFADFIDTTSDSNAKVFVNTDVPEQTYQNIDEPIVNNWMDNIDESPEINLLKDDPIAQLEVDARYYSTPEEFVKAQKKLYRGQAEKTLNFAPDRELLTPDYQGVAFTRDLEMAKPYGENILERYIDDKKVLHAKDLPKETLKKLRSDWRKLGLEPEFNQQEYEVNKVLKIALAEGYDAVDLADIYPLIAPEAEVRVLRPSVIRDVEQLIDIWKRAHPNELGNSLRGGFKEILKKSGLK